MAEGLARWTGTFWTLHKQRQGQEGKASHGDIAVLHLLLKNGEMGKALFCLSVYLHQCSCSFIHHLSASLSLTHMHRQKQFWQEAGWKIGEEYSFPTWVCRCRKSVNFYYYCLQKMLSSPRRLAAQLRCETWGWEPVGHLTPSAWGCCSAPTAATAAKAVLTSSCLYRRQRWVWVSVEFHLFVVERGELVFKHVAGSCGRSLPSCLHHNPVLAGDHTHKKITAFSETSRGVFYSQSWNSGKISKCATV